MADPNRPSFTATEAPPPVIAGLRFAGFLLAALLVGAMGAGFAIVFRLALHHGLALFAGNSDVLAAFEALPWWKRLLLPAAGGLAAGLIATIAARTAAGHGVAEVLEAVALGRGEISIPGVLLKSLASLCAIIGGGSIGREGSIIQFGAGSGSFIGRRLRLDGRQVRALVAAGTAAGFAAAYNTPIAAVVFVFEIVTGLINLEIALPVVAATAIATLLTRVAIGGGPLYGARAFQIASRWEVLGPVVLGALAGIGGPLFMAMLSGGEKLARRLPKARWFRAALGGLGVGALAIGVPAVTGNGFEAIQRILDARVGIALVALWLGTKAIATVFSVSSGSPGGVFTPTLFLGTALGGLFGHAIALLFHRTAFPGSYALIGMAAMTAATTHAPLMAATLVFELSGDYAVVLPLLLATSVAAFVSSRLRSDSIYTEELARRGIPWRGNLTERLARTVRASDILSMDAPCVGPDTPLVEVLARFVNADIRAVYVVDPQGVRRIDVHLALRLCREGRSSGLAGEVAVPLEAVTPDATLLELSEKLWGLDWGEVPVVEDGTSGRFLGVVTRRDLLGALDREILQRDILLTRVVRFEASGEAADYLELPPGDRVELVTTPPPLVGKRIDHAALRARFGVLVVAVRTGTRAGELLDPPAEYELRATDRLLVIGTAEGIERLRRTESVAA